MLNDNVLDCKELILEYCGNNEIHTKLNLSFKELFCYVWHIVKESENANEIKRIMNIEMRDAECQCFTGRISRLINCLNGFTPLVNININDSAQIANIIKIVATNLGDSYSVERHKNGVEKELKDRGYDDNVIREWLEYIE